MLKSQALFLHYGCNGCKRILAWSSWHYVGGLLHGFFQAAGLLTSPFRKALLVFCHLGTYDKSIKTGIRVKRGWQFVLIFIIFLLFVIAATVSRANSMNDYWIILKRVTLVPSEIAHFISDSQNLGFQASIKNLFLLRENISGYGIKNCLTAMFYVFSFSVSTS